MNNRSSRRHRCTTEPCIVLQQSKKAPCRTWNMPHIRFRDLRHSAATNMHKLTVDFYTVGEILGHTLKGIGLSLGISTNMADVTTRYVDVRLDRKRTVLEAYHNAMFPREAERLAAKKLSAREDHER